MTRGELYELIEAVIGGLKPTAGSSSDQGETDAAGLAAAMVRALPPAAAVNGQKKSTTAKSGDEGEGGVGEFLTKTFFGGFGLTSLVAGLFGGDGGGETAPRPPRYVAPAQVHAQGGYDSLASTLTGIDYDATGQVRSVRPAANVTVNVQAMDSRSFLDHRDDIARAVREALLHSHSLSDVIGEI